MAPYQKRVIDEKNELDVKIINLSKFVHGPLFEVLSDCERDRLQRQLGVMMLYSDILNERIQAFIFKGIPDA